MILGMKILQDKNIWNFPQQDNPEPGWFKIFKKFNDESFEDLQSEN